MTADQANDTAANRAAVATTLRQAAQVSSPSLDKLRALTPPAADSALVSQYLAGVASQISLFNRLADAIARNDVAGVRAVAQQINQGKTKIDGLAQSYGFNVCGSGPWRRLGSSGSCARVRCSSGSSRSSATAVTGAVRRACSDWSATCGWSARVRSRCPDANY